MTEHEGQVVVKKWSIFAQHSIIEPATQKHPELRMLFAIPNGEARDARAGKRLKDEGVEPGVPDWLLAVARQGHHGYFLEGKREAEPGKPKGSVNPKQRQWQKRLREEGYKCDTYWGPEEGIQMLVDYLEG